MSALLEYIKLLPKATKNLPKIIEGLTNQLKMELGTLPKEEEEVIVGRRLICSQCPYLSTNAEAVGWYASSRTDQHCTMCGCPTSTRTASLESNCGIDDWNKENPNNQMPLKWGKIK